MKMLLKIKVAALVILTAFTAVGIAQTLSNEERCLAMTIYYEARGEPVHGQYAVADVVLNRVEDKRFPDGICDVIHQSGQFHWKKVLPKQNKNWIVAENIAKDIISNETFRGITDGAVFFQRSSKVPPYADKRTRKIGNHNFFL